RWQDGIFIIDLDRNFLDMLTITIIYNVLKITLLVWACETGKNQAKEIHTTIHDLLNSTNDEKIKYEHFDSDYHTRLKWSANALIADNMADLFEIIPRIVPKAVQIDSHQGHIEYYHQICAIIHKFFKNAKVFIQLFQCSGWGAHDVFCHTVRWQDGIFIIILDKNFLDVLTMTIIYNGLKIILLVWACETGKNEAHIIRTTIHDLLNNTNDEKIKYELQLFSLQMLHRKNNFSAKGLNVDATLLAAIWRSWRRALHGSLLFRGFRFKTTQNYGALRHLAAQIGARKSDRHLSKEVPASNMDLMSGTGLNGAWCLTQKSEVGPVSSAGAKQSLVVLWHWSEKDRCLTRG
ncbi:PREDICTED: uncharacterized protein LOC105460390, partial [Wasmannia auropunctata]|uniref:uncharacterized protein LOC105460390 n=1 Tax=Wasmannia auropunctata TaxID=64793 RepID=UPI0005EE6E9D